MKAILYRIPFVLVFMSLAVLLQAQLQSTLTQGQLLFSDLSNPFAGASMTVNGINIQNGFNSTSITSNSVSAGSDLLQTRIDGNGLTVKNFALFPGSESNLDLKELKFVTTGAGAVGLDEETWTFGITDVGAFDGSDPVQSALFLRYNRIIDDVAILYPLLFVNPDEGNIGIGTFDENFNAQLYVEEFGQDQVGVWSENLSISNSARWGIFSSSEGTGSGVRYGVVGQGQNSSGAKYGIYGQTTGSGTRYGVYANGDMAYTGTLTDVSDRKFKKNIREFSALARIMQLRPKSYEMKQHEFERMNLAGGQRYGFIAQELQEVFPELVREQVNAIPYQDGDSLSIEQIDYLGVEYVPMIPVLTRGMQEQQIQLAEKEERLLKLERQNEALQRENRALQRQYRDLEDRLAQLETRVLQNTAQGNSQPVSISDAMLEQNQPNPFESSTLIPYLIPTSVKSAVLQITNVKGQILKEITIPGRGEGQTMLQTDQLSSGIYFYSLVLDGEVVDTKKMVSAK